MSTDMPTYRCHLIDDDGQLSGVEIVEAASDHVAALATDRLFSTNGRAAAELWLGNVCVYRTDRQRRQAGLARVCLGRVEVAGRAYSATSRPATVEADTPRTGRR
jgi:hypothetical protein